MLPTPPPSPKPFGLCGPGDRLGQVLAGRIELTGVLGVGAYGTVYQAQDLDTGKPYAVKALNKLGLDPRQRRFQEREIRLHHLASQHDNVVSMHKIVDLPDCTYVVLEYCDEGDLFAKITEEGDYIGQDDKTRDVFLQIIDAVRHCHSLGIYHRDLKPENILVQNNGYTVKLADFGLATQDPITSDYGCGSTFYMSPECQQSQSNMYAGYKSVPNDVWSLGVILVNLTCGRNPWKRASLDDSTFKAFYRDPDFLRTILPVSNEINEILKRIFDLNPENRIGLDELQFRISTCSYFSQDSAERAPLTPPETPQFTPVEKPIDHSLFLFGNGLEPVPKMDPLPVQQHPPFSTLSFNTPRPSPIPYDVPTPPRLTHGSPQLNPYTFPARPAPPAVSSFFMNQPTFFTSMPNWSKYSFVQNFAQANCWRSVPVC